MVHLLGMAILAIARGHADDASLLQTKAATVRLQQDVDLQAVDEDDVDCVLSGGCKPKSQIITKAEVPEVPEVPYTLEKEDMKCAITEPTSRLYRLTDETLESCAAKCKDHSHCNFFSFGLHKAASVCMGCSHGTFEDHKGFTAYKLKDQKKVTETTYLAQVKCDETVKGRWNTQLWVRPGNGNFGFVVHPGYKGSAARFEGTFSKGNQNIGWTLSPNVYHTLKITFRESGSHTMTIIDGVDTTKTWSYDFKSPGAFGDGKVGSVWVDTKGNDVPDAKLVLGKEFHLNQRGRHSFKLLEA